MGEKPRGTDSRRTLHSRIGGPVYRCREAEEEEERGSEGSLCVGRRRRGWIGSL